MMIKNVEKKKTKEDGLKQKYDDEKKNKKMIVKNKMMNVCQNVLKILNQLNVHKQKQIVMHVMYKNVVKMKVKINNTKMIDKNVKNVETHKVKNLLNVMQLMHVNNKKMMKKCIE